jgi:hypothetical protein
MDASPLTYHSARALAAAAFPPRPFILEPLLAAGSAGLIYGPAGVGKSFLALGLAMAAASGGSFLGWTARRPHTVLYLEGELGAVELQRRLALFGAPPARAQLLAERPEHRTAARSGERRGHRPADEQLAAARAAGDRQPVLPRRHDRPRSRSPGRARAFS